MPSLRTPPFSSRTLVLVALWLGGVAWGFHQALAYQAAPGAEARGTGTWPAAAPFALDPLLPTLVLGAHPHCPCTRATVRELERLVARCAGRLRVHVLFYSDPALRPGWERSDLWALAASIPDADVHADPLGEVAALFGARTSGQTFLFLPGGRLAFEGGLTAGRGHEGANDGVDAVADWVLNGTGASRAPVYGCALAGPIEERP